jgi:hypothetical protein
MGSIDGEWGEFAASVLPANPAENQVAEMRMSFKAGWFAALHTLLAEGRRGGAGLVALSLDVMYPEAVEAMKTEKELLERRDAGEAGT